MREGETLFDLLTRLRACPTRFGYVGKLVERAVYNDAPLAHITWLVAALGTKRDREWMRRYWHKHSLFRSDDFFQGNRAARLSSYFLVGWELEYPEEMVDTIKDAIRHRFPYEYVLKLVQDA